MAVLHVSVPRRRLPALQMNLLLAGLPNEVQDDDGTDERVYVDVEGTQEKALNACLGGFGVQVHETSFYVPPSEKKRDGIHGTGIPNGYQSERRIMDVQGGTLSVADLSRKPNR